MQQSEDIIAQDATMTNDDAKGANRRTELKARAIEWLLRIGKGATLSQIAREAGLHASSVLRTLRAHTDYDLLYGNAPPKKHAQGLAQQATGSTKALARAGIMPKPPTPLVGPLSPGTDPAGGTRMGPTPHERGPAHIQQPVIHPSTLEASGIEGLNPGEMTATEQALVV